MSLQMFGYLWLVFLQIYSVGILLAEWGDFIQSVVNKLNGKKNTAAMRLFARFLLLSTINLAVICAVELLLNHDSLFFSNLLR